MLDSKANGNCLPGTLSFGNDLGIELPSNWRSVVLDSRTILRKWKSAGYPLNNLFLPMIDKKWTIVEKTRRETAIAQNELSRDLAPSAY